MKPNQISQSQFSTPPTIEQILSSVVVNNQQKISQYRQMFNCQPDYLNRCYLPQTLACIEIFLDEELSTKLTSNKGPGRLTGFVPRFGAYYRKQLEQCSPDVQHQLKEQLFTIIRSGYDQAILDEWDQEGVLQKPEQIDTTHRFVAWLIATYHTREGRIGHTAWDKLSQTANYFHHNLLHSLRQWALPTGFFRRLKLSTIVFHYVIAGYLLRRFELAEVGEDTNHE